MKAIMISIKPKWVAKILNGEKTIVVRKGTALYKAIQKLIDEYGYADIYVYCTKEEELFYSIDNQKWYSAKNRKNFKRLSNGVVKFKFRCYKVEEIRFDDKEIQMKSCLTEDELFDYLFVNEPYNEDMKKGYAIHISNLEIFDEPKELNEFNALQRAKATDCGYLKQCKNCGKRFNRCHLLKPLTKTPKSFIYIESEN